MVSEQFKVEITYTEGEAVIFGRGCSPAESGGQKQDDACDDHHIRYPLIESEQGQFGTIVSFDSEPEGENRESLKVELGENMNLKKTYHKEDSHNADCRADAGLVKSIS